MELPCRDKGDQLLAPGELLDIRRRLRRVAGRHDLTAVVACAFDHRTRMLPFNLAAVWMVPAGARAIGSAMVDAGFDKTRIVLQQWSRRFRPSRMLVDGRVPDLFMVSSMKAHWERGRDLIRDACAIPADRRPLIIVGGPKIIYEPWEAFGADPADAASADLAVTGEEYVLLQFLEVLLEHRQGREPLRAAFLRARDSGALDGVPGLVYARGDGAVPDQLVDTGIQRLAADLDDLPDPALGYRLLEPPSLRTTLAPRALPPHRVRRHSRLVPLVLTCGCRFGCAYCPIPAYNQRLLRAKSGARIAQEMADIQEQFGMRHFFGTDDNFFSDHQRALEIAHTLARTTFGNGKPHSRPRWGTEATIHDTLAMRDHMKVLHKAGLRALWLGVEDMTATLVRKGQSVQSTIDAFELLRRQGILPMPMLMHHDSQPLYTPGKPYGLLNQVRLLRRAGAASLQVLMISPAPGSKLYEQTYEDGLVYRSVAGRPVTEHMIDGNYVIASRHERPWRKQWNLMATYAWFYNPPRLVWSLIRPKSRLYMGDAAQQVAGMIGLAKTICRTLGWALRLRRGPIERAAHAPRSPIPMRDPAGNSASHALRGTPVSEHTEQSGRSGAIRESAE